MSAKPRRKKKMARTGVTEPVPVVQNTIAGELQISYWLIPTLIALATFVAFLPTLQNSFVNWDDEKNLVENVFYQGLSSASSQWMFTTFHVGYYQLFTCSSLTIACLTW